MIKAQNPSNEQKSAWLNARNWSEIHTYLSHLNRGDFSSIDFLSESLLALHQRNLPLALTAIESACKLAPKDPSYLNTYSDILLKTHQPQKAYEVAKQSLSLQPENLLSHMAFSQAAFVASRFSEAFQSANKVLGREDSLNDSVTSSFKQIRFKSQPIWFKSLEGRKVTLKRLNKDHAEFLKHSRQNRAFQNHLNVFKQGTDEEVIKDLDAAQRSPVDSRKIEWVIEQSQVPIGIISLVDLDLRNKRCELLIGLPDEKGFGAALESTLLVLEFAFFSMQFERVFCYVYSDNPFAQKNVKHLGFTEEGRLRKHVWNSDLNQWLDLSINGLLKDEFYENTRLMKLFSRLIGRPVHKK